MINEILEPISNSQILPNLLGAAAKYWPSLLSSAWEYCDGVELELLAADGLGLGFLFLTWKFIIRGLFNFIDIFTVLRTGKGGGARPPLGGSTSWDILCSSSSSVITFMLLR